MRQSVRVTGRITVEFLAFKILLFKILIETKSIQKEINQLSGKLERIFNAADELIFKVIVSVLNDNQNKVNCFYLMLTLGRQER